MTTDAEATRPDDSAPAALKQRPPAAATEDEKFWVILGQFLTSYGRLLPRAAEDARETARQLEPLWNRLVGTDDRVGELVARVEALHSSVDGLGEKVAASNRADAFDPYASVMQETFERNLIERVTSTVKAELRPFHQGIEALKNARPTRPDPEPSRNLLAEHLAELQTAKREAEAARKEAEAARSDSAKAREDASRQISELKATAAIRVKEEERLRTTIAQWRQAVLGAELANDESARGVCDELVAAALRAEPAAVGLLGTLMAFQVASADRLPNLLKDLGEAYYAWRPRTQPGPVDDDPLESALTRFLLGRCERLGVRNRIEIVRPSTRFNSEKHRSETGGGTVVAEVRGWVVARENGQALHRATVVAR